MSRIFGARMRVTDITFLGLLFLALAPPLLGLKLTHVIDWSWWAVTAPLWAPWAILGAFIAGYLFVWGAVKLSGLVGRKLHDRRYRKAVRRQKLTVRDQVWLGVARRGQK